MRRMNRDERRRLTGYDFHGAGRIRRNVVAGEVVSITIDLIDDEQVAEVQDGDQFVTLLMTFNPFDVEIADGQG